MKVNKLTYFKYIIFSIVLILFDQYSKYWAINTLKNNNDIVIIKDVLHLHYLDGGNTGAAWGIFSGQIVLFILLTIVAIILLMKVLNNILRFNYSLKKSIIVLSYAIVGLISGAIGNLIDRIHLKYVVDFIYFKLINFPVFNVADCFVTISCAITIIICIFFISEEEFNTIFSFKFKRNNKSNDK